MADEEGGRIFFSNVGRSLEDEDEIRLTSVGVDIGSQRGQHGRKVAPSIGLLQVRQDLERSHRAGQMVDVTRKARAEIRRHRKGIQRFIKALRREDGLDLRGAPAPGRSSHGAGGDPPRPEAWGRGRGCGWLLAGDVPVPHESAAGAVGRIARARG